VERGSIESRTHEVLSTTECTYGTRSYYKYYFNNHTNASHTNASHTNKRFSSSIWRGYDINR
jgi:hypothetical protein